MQDQGACLLLPGASRSVQPVWPWSYHFSLRVIHPIPPKILLKNWTEWHVHHHVDEHSRRCYYHWKGICSMCMVSCTSICTVKIRKIPTHRPPPVLAHPPSFLYRGRVCCTLVFSRWVTKSLNQMIFLALLVLETLSCRRRTTPTAWSSKLMLSIGTPSTEKSNQKSWGSWFLAGGRLQWLSQNGSYPVQSPNFQYISGRTSLWTRKGCPLQGCHPLNQILDPPLGRTTSI